MGVIKNTYLNDYAPALGSGYYKYAGTRDGKPMWEYPISAEYYMWLHWSNANEAWVISRTYFGSWFPECIEYVLSENITDQDLLERPKKVILNAVYDPSDLKANVLVTLTPCTIDDAGTPEYLNSELI